MKPDRGPRGRPIALVAAGMMVAAVFVSLTTLVYDRTAAIVRYDTAASAAADRLAHYHPLWITGMRLVTYAGAPAMLVPFGLLALWHAARQRHWAGLRYLVVTAVASDALWLAIRAFVARPRPADRLAPAFGWSYPSGHTLCAALTALALVVLGLSVVSTRWQRIILVLVATCWALLIAASRVALGVHWPSDLLGSWLLVAATALACAPLYRAPVRPDAPADRAQDPRSRRHTA